MLLIEIGGFMRIRNDDVSVDTDVEHIKTFCDICHKYGFDVIHAITPLGITHHIDSSWPDELIVAKSGKHTIADNPKLIEFLQDMQLRGDIMATHGLWHSHKPPLSDWRLSKIILEHFGLKPEYAVLPFNEGDYGEEIEGMKVLGRSQRLEDYLKNMPSDGKIPTEEITYCHEWRFGPNSWYSWENLENTLQRIKNGL